MLWSFCFCFLSRCLVSLAFARVFLVLARSGFYWCVSSLFSSGPILVLSPIVFLPKNNVFKCGVCKSGDDTVRSICCQHLSTSYFGGCSLQKKEYNVLQHMRSVSKFVIIDDPHCTNGMEKRFLYLVVFHRALMLMCSKSCSVNLKISAWFKLRCCSFFCFFCYLGFLFFFGPSPQSCVVDRDCRTHEKRLVSQTKSLW
jgi:hypothetical protein